MTPPRRPRRRPPEDDAPDSKKSLLSKLNANLALLIIIGTMLVNIGMTRQKFEEIIKNQEGSSAEMKAQAARLTEFRENQIGGLRDIQTLKTSVQAIDNRVLVIERTFIEVPKRERK